MLRVLKDIDAISKVAIERTVRLGTSKRIRKLTEVCGGLCFIAGLVFRPVTAAFRRLFTSRAADFQTS